MVKGVDVASTSSKEKPYNSILPYLRAKQAEKAEAVRKSASPKAEEKAESYTDAIHSIIAEE